MRVTRRIVIAIVIAAAAGFGLAGCATTPSTQDQAQPTATAQTTASSRPGVEGPLASTPQPTSQRGPQIVYEQPDPVPTGTVSTVFSSYGPITPVRQEYWANFASDTKARYGGREIRWMVAVDQAPSASAGSNWIVVAEVADIAHQDAGGQLHSSVISGMARG